jgi:peptide/nickel transport system permease protein
VTATAPPLESRRSRTGLRLERARKLWRSTHPTARWLIIIGLLITLAFAVMAIAAPLVAPYGEAQYKGLPQLQKPSHRHIFGTTNLRFDVFSRVVYGTRLAFEVVIMSTAFAMLIGVPLGLFAGYIGRGLDRALVLVMDALYAFPSLLLAIVAAFALRTYVGEGVPAAALSISVIYIPQYFRVVRNHTLAVREETFVEAARAMGAKTRTVIGRYVLFNVVQSVPVIFTVNAADAILTLAGLGFLGYGVKVPAAEWGYDISKAISDAANGFYWTALFPGLAILGLVTGLTLVGEGVNDIINPLLRRRGIRLGAAAGGVIAAPAADTPAQTPLTPVPDPAPESDLPAAGDRLGGDEALEPLAPAQAPPANQDLQAIELSPGPSSSAAAGPALEVRDLRVTYGSSRGPVTAVDGINLVIERGSSMGLVGESGCGKSTLGRAIVGILPDGTRTEGSVTLAGRDLLQLSAAELRRARAESVALIFQEPMTRLDPLQRIEDHFVETIRAHRDDVSRSEARAIAKTSLAAMRIPPGRVRSYPHEFSGGMRQRIMIALGICLDPDVVIADEPTTSLDVIVEAQILDILDDLRRRLRMGLLLITHNLGIVAESCDDVSVMYAGKIVEVGPVAAVFDAPKHPYTQGLLASVISLETTALASIPGSPPDLLDPPPGCRFARRCPFAMAVCLEEEPRLTPAEGGVEVACHLYAGADPRDPRPWVPTGRRDGLDAPPLASHRP